MYFFSPQTNERLKQIEREYSERAQKSADVSFIYLVEEGKQYCVPNIVSFLIYHRSFLPF
jgi:hypothetical protein